MSTGSVRHLFASRAEEARSRNAEEVIEAGDFRLDLNRRVATLRGQELQLTPQEFDVLVFLTRNHQRVVTPSTLLTTSWAGTKLRQAEFLKVLLSLRNKLEAAGEGKHYLRTEPWVIYRFDPNCSAM